MKTYFRKFPGLLSCGLMVAMLSACVTDRHESLRVAASRLDDASSHFLAQVQAPAVDTRHDRLSRDAELMARASHKLDVDISRGETRAALEEDYRQVEDSYEELHRQLTDEGLADQSRRVLEEFDRVTTAYRDVQSSMVLRTAEVR